MIKFQNGDLQFKTEEWKVVDTKKDDRKVVTKHMNGDYLKKLKGTGFKVFKTEEWKIVDAKKDERWQVVIMYIDEDSLKKLKGTGLKVFLGLKEVFFRMVLSGNMANINEASTSQPSS